MSTKYYIQFVIFGKTNMTDGNNFPEI